MSSSLTYTNLALDWSPQSKRDHTFNIIAIVVVSVALALGIIFSNIQVPKQERKARTVVPERIAKFILQKPPKKIKKVEPPPPPPPPPKTRVVRKREKSKDPLTKKQEKSRIKAQKLGINAHLKELADLIDTSSIDTMVGRKVRKSSSASKATKVDTAALTSNSNAGSGGVSSDKYTTAIAQTSLSLSERKALRTALASGKIDSVTRSRKSDRRGDNYRSEEEITLTMDRNKASLYSVYRSILRKNPGLKGKIVFEITIAPSGKVLDVKIKTTELNHPSLEKRLISRIKGFNFGHRSVEKVTVTFPIEFLPS